VFVSSLQRLFGGGGRCRKYLATCAAKRVQTEVYCRLVPILITRVIGRWMGWAENLSTGTEVHAGILIYLLTAVGFPPCGSGQ
jgi:hypothetical protein